MKTMYIPERFSRHERLSIPFMLFMLATFFSPLILVSSLDPSYEAIYIEEIAKLQEQIIKLNKEKETIAQNLQAKTNETQTDQDKMHDLEGQFKALQEKYAEIEAIQKQKSLENKKLLQTLQEIETIKSHLEKTIESLQKEVEVKQSKIYESDVTITEQRKTLAKQKELLTSFQESYTHVLEKNKELEKTIAILENKIQNSNPIETPQTHTRPETEKVQEILKEHLTLLKVHSDLQKTHADLLEELKLQRSINEAKEHSIQRLEQTIKDLEDSPNRSLYEEIVPNYQEQKERLLIQIEDLEAQLEDLESQNAELTDRLELFGDDPQTFHDEVEKLYNEHQELNAENESLQQKIQNQTDEITALKEKIADQRAEFETQKSAIENEKTLLEQDKQALNQTIKELTSKLNDLEAVLKTSKESIEQLTEKLISSETEIKAAQAEADRARAETATLQTQLASEQKNHAKQEQANKEKISLLEKEKITLETLQEKTRIENETLKQSIKELQQEHANQIHDLEENIKTLQKENTTSKEALHEIETTQVKTLEDEKATLEKQLRTLEEKCTNLEHTQLQTQAINTQNQELQARVQDLEKALLNQPLHQCTPPSPTKPIPLEEKEEKTHVKPLLAGIAIGSLISGGYFLYKNNQATKHHGKVLQHEQKSKDFLQSTIEQLTQKILDVKAALGKLHATTKNRTILTTNVTQAEKKNVSAYSIQNNRSFYTTEVQMLGEWREKIDAALKTEEYQTEIKEHFNHRKE